MFVAVRDEIRARLDPRPALAKVLKRGRPAELNDARLIGRPR